MLADVQRLLDEIVPDDAVRKLDAQVRRVDPSGHTQLDLIDAFHWIAGNPSNLELYEWANMVRGGWSAYSESKIYFACPIIPAYADRRLSEASPVQLIAARSKTPGRILLDAAEQDLFLGRNVAAISRAGEAADVYRNLNDQQNFARAQAVVDQVALRFGKSDNAIKALQASSKPMAAAKAASSAAGWAGKAASAPKRFHKYHDYGSDEYSSDEYYDFDPNRDRLYLSDAYLRINDPDSASAMAHEVLLSRNKDHFTQALALQKLGEADYKRKKYGDATTHLQDSLIFYKHSEDASGEQAVSYEEAVLYELGQVKRAAFRSRAVTYTLWVLVGTFALACFLVASPSAMTAFRGVQRGLLKKSRPGRKGGERPNARPARPA
jgi:hypothetical protein